MAGLVKTVARWSKAPARDVDAPSGGWVNMVRGLAARATTPLLPDDYLSLLNPLWSARELRGEIVAVKPETEDSATVIIRPGWGFSADYAAGQYVGIGLRVDGRWHWRSYSLTSVPEQSDNQISITVKATPEGFLSTHLVDGVEPGTIIRLAAPKGEFTLPDPPPPRLLFITAGSGITPIMAMLRSLRARGQRPDIVHVHSAPTEDAVIFCDELRELEHAQDGYRLHLHLTREQGKVDFDRFDELLSPTDYTPASKRIHRVGQRIARDHEPQDAVVAAANWVHSELDYVPGTTGVHSSGLDALREGKGVCQDFAHLALALLTVADEAGATLALVGDRAQAFVVARQNELSPVSAH